MTPLRRSASHFVEDWLQPAVSSKLLRAGLEAALVVVLGVQAARLVWIAATPFGPIGQASDVRPTDDGTLAILSQFDPFAARGGGPQAVTTAEPSLGLSLFGVRAQGDGAGAAIIGKVGAPQRVYGIGDEVAPGIVLESIAADHVVLARGGIASRLDLTMPSSQPGATAIPSYLIRRAPAPAALKPAPAVTIDPKKLLAEAGLRPRTQDGRTVGYTLLPRGNADTFRRAGLQAGDVLLALNGNQITPERYSELEQELASAPEVQLTVQRGSETKTITLQTGR